MLEHRRKIFWKWRNEKDICISVCISTHTHTYTCMHIHGLYDIYHLWNAHSFITYWMHAAAHIYMEDYLFKGHDSFPYNFDITLPKKYQDSKISITLSKESHYNCLTDNNLQYNLSLSVMMALGFIVYGKMETISKYRKTMLKKINALFHTRSICFIFNI